MIVLLRDVATGLAGIDLLTTVARAQVESTVVEGVLEMIRADRRKDAIDRGLLKSMVRMLVDLGIYADTFLTPFLTDSDLLYSGEGVELTASLSIPDYLLHCETRLAEEHDRCAAPPECFKRRRLQRSVPTGGSVTVMGHAQQHIG